MNEENKRERKKPLATLTFSHSKSEEDLILFAQFSELSFGGIEAEVVDANTVEIRHNGNPAYHGQDLQDRVLCTTRVGKTVNLSYLKNGRTITEPQLYSLFDTQLKDLLEHKKVGVRQLEKNYGWSDEWVPDKKTLKQWNPL